MVKEIPKISLDYKLVFRKSQGDSIIIGIFKTRVTDM